LSQLAPIDKVYTLRYKLVVPGEFEFDWDHENTKHLAAHKVTPAEFEQVLNNDPLDVDCEFIDNEERYRSVGLTSRGRLLSVAWTIRNCKVRAVTAFPATVPDRKAFLEQTR
jgi:uncharacterized DUF497 family protein